MKLRVAIGETHSSHCQRITALPRRINQNVFDAGGLFEKNFVVVFVTYRQKWLTENSRV